MSLRNTSTDERSLKPASATIGPLLYILIGPITWSAHFTLIYGLQSIVCAIAQDERVSQIEFLIFAGIWAATALAIFWLVFSFVASRKMQELFGVAGLEQATRRTLTLISTSLSALSVFGIVAGAATTLFVSACGTGT